MRATQTTTYRSLGTFLNRASERMADLQLQAATGKRLNRPSDDPTAISPVLSARTQIQASDRYIETIDTGTDRINNMDGTFEHIENILQRVREITIAGVNGSLSPEDMATFGDEVGQLKEELLSAANAQVDGKYLFGGYQTKTTPFIVNPAYDPLTYDPTYYDPATNPPPVLYQGDAGQLKMEIAPGELVRVGVDGATFFLGLRDDNTAGATGFPDGIPSGTYSAGDSVVGSDLFHQLTLLEADLKANQVSPLAEQQSGDFSAVTVAAGETLTFNINAETITYTNDTAGVALSGAALVADIAAKLATATATGSAGAYLFSQDGAAAAQLNITQAPGNESGIGQITMVNQTPANNVAGMVVDINGTAGLSGRLDSFDQAMEQASKQRSLLGNIGSRLQTARGHMEDIRIDMDEMRSRYEDADIIATITSLQQQQQAFEAALNVTGQVSSLSILDFLR
jgi:flagellar hook-associated protein 3 FlgL